MATLRTLVIPFLFTVFKCASAIPYVTPIPFGVSCSGFPGVRPSPGDTSGPGGFYFTADQADNSTINGLRSSSFDETVILDTLTDGAVLVFFCNNGTITSSDFSQPVNTIYFSDDASDAELAYLSTGNKMGTYVHEIDGVIQNDIFIGAGGVTTWAFKFQPNPAWGRDVVKMRLLGPNSADPTTGEPLEEGEFKGFLKVRAWGT